MLTAASGFFIHVVVFATHKTNKNQIFYVFEHG